MKNWTLSRKMRRAMAAFGVALLLGAGGCARIKVVPVPNPESRALQADDIAILMRQSGFDDQEIIKGGSDLRNTLANECAAVVRLGDKAEVMMGIYKQNVHVSSYTRGNFIYDPQTKRIR